MLQPPHLTRPSTRPPLLLRSDPALHSLHAIGEPGRIRLSSRALRPSTSTVYHDLPSHPLLWYTLRIVQTTQVLLEMLQRVAWASLAGHLPLCWDNLRQRHTSHMHPLPRHTKRVYVRGHFFFFTQCVSSLLPAIQTLFRAPDASARCLCRSYCHGESIL